MDREKDVIQENYNVHTILSYIRKKNMAKAI